MKLIRIKANYTENPKEYMIFTVLSDGDFLVTDTEMFGYVADEGEDSNLEIYPFIIKPTRKKDFIILNYGADSEYATSKVNLPQKKLIVGEYITRWDDNDKNTEFTYVIDRITEIIS